MTGVYLVSSARFYRDSLAVQLAKEFELVGKAADPIEALSSILDSNAEVVLLDGDVPGSISAVRTVVELIPDAKVVILGMPEVERTLIELAEAGIAGYVSRDGSVADVLAAITSAAQGETLCSPRMAATLLRRVATLAKGRSALPSGPYLTPRQLEILDLIEQGLSNKEIARHLCIEVPTVKNHLRSIYERLDVHRRGEAAARARNQGLIRTPPRASNG